MAFLIEVVVYGRMNGGEVLQTWHVQEAKHVSFSWPKGQTGILSPVVYPTAGLLPFTDPDNSQRSTIRPLFVRHDDFGVTVAFH